MTDLLVSTSAKVNLCLRVLGKRADGYHEVETVLHTIALWDRIRLSPASGGPRISLKVNSADVPADDSNLCWRAAELLAKRAGATPAVSIELEKSIPAGAGLGGGSSDAAATLAGLIRMWGLDLPPSELADLAAEIGADVPFFLRGGCCLARGRGERLEDLPPIDAWLVLVVPERRVPTAQAYAALARGSARGRRRGLTRVAQRTVKALNAADTHGLAESLRNDFEALAMPAIADARDGKAALLDAGCLGAGLSGSGSAVFGIAPDEATANDVAARTRGRCGSVIVTRTLPPGRSLVIRNAGEA